jgi:small subunit ribosomal protein S9
MADVKFANGTGRRKTAVARVFLRQRKDVGVVEADPKERMASAIKVNGRPLQEYFKSEFMVRRVVEPLDVTDTLDAYDVLITVRGGGPSGQAGACRHGLARALLAQDESNRSSLRTNGMLTRDRRMVERKKYGQPKARAHFQFSKR